MESLQRDLLTGNLDVNDVPELPSKVIKVYVASAVTGNSVKVVKFMWLVCC